MKETIVKDGRTLRAISRRTGIIFDPVHKYCTGGAWHEICGKTSRGISYNGGKYILLFVDGCFFPFLFRVSE